MLFFDEIDGMIRTRSEADHSCVYGFKTEFLTHMDGIHGKSSDSVIVIGCTNCADKLDPAIQRRLPKKYRINLPTNDEIVDIFLLNLQETKLSRIELTHIVDLIKPGCSGSDIADIVRTAWTIQMLHHTESNQFMSRLQDESTTAHDVHRMVGTITTKHLVEALKSKDMLMEVDSDDEAPPGVEEVQISRDR